MQANEGTGQADKLYKQDVTSKLTGTSGKEAEELSFFDSVGGFVTFFVDMKL